MIMPVEVVLGTVASVLAIGTALFGGGLFKQALKHAGDMAIQKHELEQQKSKVRENDLAIQRLTTDLALVNKDIEGFSAHVRKLEMLPEISSKLSGLEALMGYIKEQLKDFRSERIEHDKK
jgi:hypothetical protein